MKVAVIKYNAGNIRSVDYALRRLGVEAEITADEAVLRARIKLSFRSRRSGNDPEFSEWGKYGSVDKGIASTGAGDLSGHAVDVSAFGRRKCGLLGYF